MLDQVENWLNDLAIIANQNREKAKALGEKYIWYSADKNKDIKSKLKEEGEKLHCDGYRLEARTSGEKSRGEWLYDFTLRKFDLADKSLAGILLAVEIELSGWMSKPSIIYDFNKLLQSDSDFKLFIFQEKTVDKCDEILNYIYNSIKKYNHKICCEYLVSCWITSEYKFVSKRFTVNGLCKHTLKCS